MNIEITLQRALGHAAEPRASARQALSHAAAGVLGVLLGAGLAALLAPRAKALAGPRVQRGLDRVRAALQLEPQPEAADADWGRPVRPPLADA